MFYIYSANGKADNPNLLEETEPKLNREVSFDIEIINNSPSNEPKRKSSMRGASRTGPVGANRSPSTKSVVIDPVPSTTFYSEGSDGASDKTDQPKTDLATTKKVITSFLKNLYIFLTVDCASYAGMDGQVPSDF